MDNKGYNNTMARNGEHIEHTNYVALTNFSKAYSGYNTKYTMNPNDNDPWQMQERMDEQTSPGDYDVDFPATIGGQPIKKACQNPHKHQDTALITTTDSDDRTEFDS
jgi:hypothetical protein